MPNKVIGLFACWWTGGSSQSVVLEDGAFLPYVVLVEERNDRNFEYQERMLEELKSFF
jgi:hypothetical protein